MGGDFAPRNTVAGAVEAVRDAGSRFSVVLVGPEDRLRAELGSSPGALQHPALSVAHASEIIEMHDSPTAALKSKKDSSIVVGVTLHREGKADAFVSAGNTGAVLSASTLLLGRIPGASRPTIGTMLPTEGSPCLLVDAGTNVDCRARHLFEFAAMGSAYVSAMRGTERPRVGLLSIGEEDSKGNEASLEALALLRESDLHFLGNIEGGDILAGRADVVVCDGFVGNILLKFGESIPGFLRSRFRTLARRSLRGAAAAFLAGGALRGIMKELDYQEHGGVPLLGINGVSIIGHGRSSPRAIRNMIFRAEEMVRKQVNGHIRQALLRFA